MHLDINTIVSSLVSNGDADKVGDDTDNDMDDMVKNKPHIDISSDEDSNEDSNVDTMSGLSISNSNGNEPIMNGICCYPQARIKGLREEGRKQIEVTDSPKRKIYRNNSK